MNDGSLEIILGALRCVEADQVVFRRDASTGQLAAKVLLREDQLDEALREDGRYLREAAMATGIRIDVELANSESA